MIIKLCGCTRLEDVLFAADCGVDWLGFVFADSPRRISPAAATEMIGRLPSGIRSVGVFVDEDLEDAIRIIRACGLQMVQLHGRESPAYARRIPVPVIRSIRVENGRALAPPAHYPARAYLLDPRDPYAPGGGGAVDDWKTAVRSAPRGDLLIAGGLRPDNVRRAIIAARPFGVDVSSGVESAPGIKDPHKLKHFIREVKSCAQKVDPDTTAGTGAVSYRKP